MLDGRRSRSRYTAPANAFIKPRANPASGIARLFIGLLEAYEDGSLGGVFMLMCQYESSEVRMTDIQIAEIST